MSATMIEGHWAPLQYQPDPARVEARTLGVLLSNGVGEWRFLVDDAAVAWLRRDYGITEDVFGANWAEGLREIIADLGPDNLLARPDGYAWGYRLHLAPGRSTLIEDAGGAIEREARWLLDRVAHPPSGALASLGLAEEAQP